MAKELIKPIKSKEPRKEKEMFFKNRKKHKQKETGRKENVELIRKEKKNT